MKHLIKRTLPVLDYVFLLFAFPSAWILKAIRLAGSHRLPMCRDMLIRTGVYPLLDHYYEPQFDFRALKKPLTQDRSLPGIEWNVPGQLALLSKLQFANELAGTPMQKTASLEFHFNNGSFESGDAEYWYQVIRYFKPSRIFEVGSGNSTLMAIKAINKNREDDPSYTCKHVCIEPYEMPWLEKTGVTVIRQKIEDIDVLQFSELKENDILFIDSSHIIRPQGDVLYEYLELLPTLNPGVIVHVHDIFSPKNYLTEWLVEKVKFWNEQYLLEAFLSHNNHWQILGALHYLGNNHRGKLMPVTPFLTEGRSPGSFYMQKIL